MAVLEMSDSALEGHSISALQQLNSTTSKHFLRRDINEHNSVLLRGVKTAIKKSWELSAPQTSIVIEYIKRTQPFHSLMNPYEYGKQYTKTKENGQRMPAA